MCEYISSGGGDGGFLKLFFWISVVYISYFISWKMETNRGTAISEAVKPTKAIRFLSV